MKLPKGNLKKKKKERKGKDLNENRSENNCGTIRFQRLRLQERQWCATEVRPSTDSTCGQFKQDGIATLASFKQG